MRARGDCRRRAVFERDGGRPGHKGRDRDKDKDKETRRAGRKRAAGSSRRRPRPTPPLPAATPRRDELRRGHDLSGNPASVSTDHAHRSHARTLALTRLTLVRQAPIRLGPFRTKIFVRGVLVCRGEPLCSPIGFAVSGGTGTKKRRDESKFGSLGIGPLIHLARASYGTNTQ